MKKVIVLEAGIMARKIILGLLVLVVILFILGCCKVAGKWSRCEEKQNLIRRK